ncbi:DUF6113 family protein [Streptomyces sp. NBC_00239]|uniref:DUF6113 family protein n=1 Tax=Streptomyces sp. NBC_00239 TaxID=2903640 RepID=UPI002E2AEC1A|nr:DUF6113 family protein [Streptomyces sp. NBC_00239]
MSGPGKQRPGKGGSGNPANRNKSGNQGNSGGSGRNAPGAGSGAGAGAGKQSGGATRAHAAGGHTASARSAGPGPGGLMTGRPTAAGTALFLLLLLVGALTGIAGGLVVGAWPPFGAALCLLATACCFLGGRIAMRGSLGVAATALGWFAVLMVFVSPRPEGDNLYAATTGTYVYMLGGIVAAVMCATLQGPAGRPVPAARPGG